MAQEHQPAVAVVVGERAERLRAQRHLRVEPQPSLEHRSVHAAHAVDGDLLDEELLLDHGVALVGLVGGLAVQFGVGHRNRC